MNRFIRAVSALAAACAPSPVLADTVADWSEFGAAVIKAASERGSGVAHGETQAALAMFEALNAIDRRYESYLGFAQGDPAASQDVAAATASYRVLLTLYPSQTSALNDGYAVAMTGTAEGPAKETAKAIGEAAAAAALKAGGLDPAIAQKPYRPRTAAGVWTATALPVFEPHAAAMRPWIIEKADALRPPPPPRLSSARWAKDFNEVKRLGGATGSERTPEQTLMANYRIIPDLSPTLRAIADGPGRSMVQNARLYALMAMADNDAILSIGDAKMHYEFWRPIVAIRNAADDGNAATAPDAGWTPLISTPNHPEYPCGHCIRAAAAGAVLKGEVGDAPPGGLRVKSGLHLSPVQIVPTIDEWVASVSMSRIYGGVHFRFSNEAAELMGSEIGRIANGALMQPIAGSE